MKMICPMCKGMGVTMDIPQKLMIPKANMKDLMKNAKQIVCSVCKGTGEVESGFMAKELGKTVNLNEEGEK